MRYDPIRYLLLGLIKLYQLTVSPLLGPVCRFYPSCSHYGYQAIHEHGSLRGTWLTVRRLLRCHPWNQGGIDPVPPRVRKGSVVSEAVPPAGPSVGPPPRAARTRQTEGPSELSPSVTTTVQGV